MMQYDETSFSMNGNVTMVAKKPDVVQLGNEVGFTGIDSRQAMLLYQCNGKIFKYLHYYFYYQTAKLMIHIAFLNNLKLITPRFE